MLICDNGQVVYCVLFDNVVRFRFEACSVINVMLDGMATYETMTEQVMFVTTRSFGCFHE